MVFRPKSSTQVTMRCVVEDREGGALKAWRQFASLGTISHA